MFESAIGDLINSARAKCLIFAAVIPRPFTPWQQRSIMYKLSIVNYEPC